jgi:CPA2 family monovalent cation:H+ antiporter-2
MTHGGEDGLLLLTQAMRVGAIEPNVGQPALVAFAATMALGPMLIQPSARLAELVSCASHRTRADSEEAAIREESQNLRDHVILCGCGRVGRPVSLVLKATKVPYIAIEFDLIRFRRAKKAGHKVVFGTQDGKGFWKPPASPVRASSLSLLIDAIRLSVFFTTHASKIQRYPPL